MQPEFALAHVGINTEGPQVAVELSAMLCHMFNLTPRHGNKSEFAGSYVECMKAPYLGRNGHIAFKTDNLEAAVIELCAKGYSIKQETASYTEEGKLKNVYLDIELCGFAIHLMQE